jgi:hypothetical protein
MEELKQLIAHRLDILPAPDYIVQEYIKDIINED